MKRHRQLIARFLLALLLLLQLGSAAAAFVPPVVNAQCHNHAAVLGHGALGTGGHNLQGSLTNCDDSGCAMHCALAPLVDNAVPSFASPSFVSSPFLAGVLPALRPDRLERPPKSISR